MGIDSVLNHDQRDGNEAMGARTDVSDGAEANVVVRDIAVANPPGCVGECFRVRALSDLVNSTGASRKQVVY